MKKRFLFLVGILAMLIISPAVCIPSFMQFQDNNGFVLADDWNQTGNSTLEFDTPDWQQTGNASLRFETPKGPSPYSIHGFAETSDDDFWITPDKDQFYPTFGEVLGEDPGIIETNTWEDGIDDDGSYWQVEGDGGIGLQFYVQLPKLQIGHFLEISMDWKCSDDSFWQITQAAGGYFGIEVYDSGGAAGYEFRTVSVAVTTAIIAYQNSTGHIGFNFIIDGDGEHCYVDNAFVEVGVSGYWESFVDVSDWTLQVEGGAGAKSFTTDGDVVHIQKALASTSNEYLSYQCDFTPITVTDQYFELRYNLNSVGKLYCSVYDGVTWTNLIDGEHGIGTWVTEKHAVFGHTYDGNTIESVRIYIDDWSNSYTSPLVMDFYGDYLHIGPSDEAGWQHDCSTTAGVTNSTYATVATDGDKITLNSTSGTSSSYFLFDTTATRATMDTGYYQFMEISISEVFDYNSNGEVYYLRLYDAGSAHLYDLTGSYQDDIGTLRFNLGATTYDDYEYLRIYTREFDWVVIDYIQLYSIANHSISLTDDTTTDVLFVDNEILYSNITSATIVLDRDPEINVTTNYRSYQMYPTTGNPAIAFYGSGWLDYYTASSGALPVGQVLTDLRLRFTTDSSVQNITFLYTSEWFAVGEASLFFDTPTWETVAQAILSFFNQIDQDDLALWIILIGAILIPASTVYLVIGGRKDMSVDKFLLFLIIFFMGWALLLGGILA